MILENLINHIINIRSIKQISQENCALMLGISTEVYGNFEDGVNFISLPELEILSNYLGISLETQYSDNISSEEPQINMLKEALRPQFKSLRNKMICAKLAHEIKEKATSIEMLQQISGIPIETLAAYLQESTPIPINHLCDIANALSIPLEGFTIYNDSTKKTVEDEDYLEDWSPKTPQIELVDSGEDTYQVLINAFKALPMNEQARITKLMLNVLKNQ